MRNRYILGIAIFVMLLSSALSILAGEGKELIEVTATGVGKDSDGALKNALRAAIEQAVGTLVDSETLASNDEIVNDQILSYSAGFVESHKVVGEPKMSDGLVSIKIIAKVRRTQLTEKLKAASIHMKEVDGGSLFGEAITKLERKQSGVEIIARAFDGFPENVLEAKIIGKPSYDEGKKQISLEIEVRISKEKYKEFTKNIIPILNEVASSSEKMSISPSIQQGNGDLIVNMLVNIWKDKAIAICTRLNEARNNGTWEIFRVSQEILNAAANTIGMPLLSVAIMDDEDEAIVSGNFKISSPFSFGVIANAKQARTRGVDSDVRSFGISPILDSTPNDYHAHIISPGTESQIFKVSFDVSPDELKQMKTVVCKIESNR